MLAGLTLPATASAFGIEDFSTLIRKADGTVGESAASHPFALDIHLSMDAGQPGGAEGPLRQIQVDLPPGLVGNPLAVPRCSRNDFDQLFPVCSGATQVGVLRGIVTGLGEINAPVFNVAPSIGEAGAFGVSLNGEALLLRFTLAGGGAGGALRLTGLVPPNLDLIDLNEQIWGVPADPAHDPERVCPEFGEGCPAGVEEEPLLTLPASCSEPLRTTLTATSAGPLPLTAVATALSRDAAGNPTALVGCETPPFDPRLAVQFGSEALAPTGLTLGVELPQHEAVGITATAAVAAVRLELPAGVALNPSAGSWLSACSPDEIGLESAAGVLPPVLSDAPASCPGGSKLGSVTLQTPLVDHELAGSIYLASPTANPFAARFAIYLVVEDVATGIVLKIPARLDADPASGRLTASIPELPQLPFDDLELSFAAGPRAPLANLGECGRYEANAVFTPSSAPFRPAASRQAGFALVGGPGGEPCPRPEVERNAVPSFQASSENAFAGGSSSFLIRLGRGDADQQLGAFDLKLPPGLLANLGSVGVCADATLRQADGASCPADSAIGSVTVGAGLGPEPARLSGTAYLAGPYRGAPYSLAIVVPARVGPFDLGTIVQRAALDVDPETGQISVSSDPLPQIFAGVPLELRSLRLDLDRPGFVRNPSSCEPMKITGSATTSLGVTTPLSQRFQVGDCAALPFAPKLSLRASGALGRNGHPALRAVVRGERGEATLARLGFTLPAGELLDLRHLRVLCPRVMAAADCPRDSRLGNLRLESPLLDGALEGAVYLRRPSGKLPDLVAELRSAHLRLLLHGGTTNWHGGFGLSFGSLPDIPLSRAVLSLFGGRRGIVVNSRSLCARTGIATATAAAHSGKHRQLRVPLRSAGC